MRKGGSKGMTDLLLWKRNFLRRKKNLLRRKLVTAAQEMKDGRAAIQGADAGNWIISKLWLFVPAQSLPGTLMGVMALKTPQATTADHKSGGRWLPKTVFCICCYKIIHFKTVII